MNPFRDLFDAAVRYPSVKITCCRCGHSVILSTHGLWNLFEKKGWADRFRHVQRRLVCTICWYRAGEKVRMPEMEFGDWPHTDTRLKPPSQFEWKAARRRRR